MKKVLIICVASLLFTSISSCVGFKSMAPLTPAKVGANDLIIVGAIKISPEIVYEKRLTSTTDGKNTVELIAANDPMIIFSTDKSSKILNIELGSLSALSTIDYVRQNQVFIIKTPKADEIFLRGFGIMIDEGYVAKADRGIPNGFLLAADYAKRLKIEVPAGARAIYIGTITFNRDDNYLPLNYSIEDEYDDAKAEFSSRFPDFELVRADIVDLEAKK